MTTHEGLEVRQIDWGSREYRQALRLRDEVLRRPLGMRLREEDLAPEEHDAHVGAFRGGQLIGTLVLTDHGDHLRMRQVVVAEHARGGGVGAGMVRFSEALARAGGRCRMELHARQSAVSFYLRNGYSRAGDEFEEVGIPHVKMVKRL